MISERQRCPDVAFIEGSNGYRSNVDILAYLAFKCVAMGNPGQYMTATRDV
jgi:hypothetical protein